MLFFSNYLIGKKTQYVWNNFIYSFFSIYIGIEQGSAFSPILSTLYISPIFYIFKKRTKNLNIPISFLSFVDNELFISQEETFEKTNTLLFYSYNIVSSLFNQFGLVIKHGKSEVFHFSRSHESFNSSSLNSPSLDLSIIEGFFLQLKNVWRYLSFIFNRKLSFYQHIIFYSNKALSTIKKMKMLENLT